MINNDVFNKSLDVIKTDYAALISIGIRADIAINLIRLSTTAFAKEQYIGFENSGYGNYLKALTVSNSTLLGLVTDYCKLINAGFSYDNAYSLVALSVDSGEDKLNNINIKTVI